MQIHGHARTQVQGDNTIAARGRASHSSHGRGGCALVVMLHAGIDGVSQRQVGLMAARDDIARLLKEAAASMKTDAKGAVAKLESAYAVARESGDADDTATVAEELARGWARRKSTGRSLYYAMKA